MVDRYRKDDSKCTSKAGYELNHLEDVKKVLYFISGKWSSSFADTCLREKSEARRKTAVSRAAEIMDGKCYYPWGLPWLSGLCQDDRNAPAQEKGSGSSKESKAARNAKTGQDSPECLKVLEFIGSGIECIGSLEVIGSSSYDDIWPELCPTKKCQ